MSMQLVNILYTEVGKKLSPEQYSIYFEKLPNLIRQKINRFIRWQDRQASLFGKLLLLEGVMQYGYPDDCLNNISTEKYGRPFLDDKIDFNISHSDGYAICAISKEGRVGVDIERISTRINFSDFKHFMGPDLFNIIIESKEPYKSFYELWTRNESVIKADGKGLLVPFSNIFYIGNMALLCGTAWFIKKLQIDSRYCCYFATNLEKSEIILRKFSFSSPMK